MKNNIVLIGMPGAGKSTLGVLLAKALGKNFIDTDIVIQHREQKLLQEIIDTCGTDEFLLCEENAILSLTAENSVIATGGSAVYSEKAMKKLQENGTIVYLNVPFDEIRRRITDITTRGIVLPKGKSLSDSYKERTPLYEKYCDFSVDCSTESIESTVREIVNAIKQ